MYPYPYRSKPPRSYQSTQAGQINPVSYRAVHLPYFRASGYGRLLAKLAELAHRLPARLWSTPVPPPMEHTV